MAIKIYCILYVNEQILSQVGNLAVCGSKDIV